MAKRNYYNSRIRIGVRDGSWWVGSGLAIAPCCPCCCTIPVFIFVPCIMMQMVSTSCQFPPLEVITLARERGVGQAPGSKKAWWEKQGVWWDLGLDDWQHKGGDEGFLQQRREDDILDLAFSFKMIIFNKSRRNLPLTVLPAVKSAKGKQWMK